MRAVWAAEGSPRDRCRATACRHAAAAALPHQSHRPPPHPAVAGPSDAQPDHPNRGCFANRPSLRLPPFLRPISVNAAPPALCPSRPWRLRVKTPACRSAAARRQRRGLRRHPPSRGQFWCTPHRHLCDPRRAALRICVKRLPLPLSRCTP